MTIRRIDLDPHWQDFIDAEVASGRYCSTEAVVCDGLRILEDRERRRRALRAHLDEGAAQAGRGEFVDFSLERLIAESDREG